MAVESAQMLSIAGSSEQALDARINALRSLAASRDAAVQKDLRTLLNRQRKLPEYEIKNWDPAGVERIVDLHVIEALHELGDDSELHRIGPLVRQAGSILQGPDEEVSHAAEVIRNIRRNEPLDQLIQLTKDPDERVVRNAVRTLNLLDLPDEPIGGDASSIDRLSDPVTFEIERLKTEIEKIAELSQGSIILSDGARSFIQANDFDRGRVKREQVKLAEVVEQELEVLDLCYYLADQRIVICTYPEAGQRWRTWRLEHQSILNYE